MIFFLLNEKQEKRGREKCYIHNILQQILSSMLLQVVIDSKKIIPVVGSNYNLTPRICCVKYYESSTSQKKKKQYTKKFTIFFTIVELANLPPSI